MIRSIRYFLLISLLLSITIAAVINGVGNYLLDEKVIQPYLDNELLRVSTLINSLYEATANTPRLRTAITQHLGKTDLQHGQKFIFQVWGDHQLLLHSPNQPLIPLENAKPGFSDQVKHGNDWRIYSVYNERLNVKIVVAELYNLRRELADDIAHSNANILIITYPIFGLLVWLIINLALRSVSRVTTEISNRAYTFLEPVQLHEIPVEIKPLVAELNRLFLRLKLAFERNKRFAGDAAHELRTPLAALKTHAQVALKSDNDMDRTKALEKVIESVNRSSHVVAQLLTLSRLGEEEALTDVKPLNLHKLAIEMIAYVAPQAIAKNIELELATAPKDSMVMGSDTSLGILIRNIVDNAIRYTPHHGEVHISIRTTRKKVILRVIDTGPGIPEELRERVFERFYRILGTNASGSGLGLAIVSQIASLHHAEITLSSPLNHAGLQIDVAFPRFHA
ncbi:MAG: hypothetical protein A3E85_05110 [Gammaproteobacteria bacterium RIFCSPHIGHO2_12_FULL_45_12]|nr:MAG: hypothetical protein A3E85_05110 [Gammaproteobacteria bacterium RIFCSPHIGHO2_12_FULL_45_12]